MRPAFSENLYREPFSFIVLLDTILNNKAVALLFKITTIDVFIKKQITVF